MSVPKKKTHDAVFPDGLEIRFKSFGGLAICKKSEKNIKTLTYPENKLSRKTGSFFNRTLFSEYKRTFPGQGENPFILALFSQKHREWRINN